MSTNNLHGFRLRKASLIDALFLGETQGAALNVADRKTLFLDAARTDPVTGPGDPVGGATDLSGNNNHFEQTVDADRMIYGVVPVGGRTNLLTHTESIFGNWVPLSGEASITDGIDDPDGGSGAFRFTWLSGNGRVNNGSISIPAGKLRHGFWCRSVDEIGDTSLNSYRIVISNQVSTLTFESQLIPGEWAYVTLSDEITSDSTLLQFRCRNVIYDIYLPQTNAGEELKPYQRVGNQYDVTEAGVRSIPYLSTNYTNQFISTDLPAGTYTVAIAGTEGSWFDEIEHAGGAFDLGPTTYPGGPEGILEVLGNFIGWTYREGAISATERERIKAHYKSLGSPGEFVLGDEKVVNNEFEDGDTGWTLGTGWSISGGLLTKAPDTGLNEAQATLVSAIEPQNAYLVGATLARVAGSSSTLLIAADNTIVGMGATKTYRSVITGFDTSQFRIRGSDGTDTDFSSTTVRKLELVP